MSLGRPAACALLVAVAALCSAAGCASSSASRRGGSASAITLTLAVGESCCQARGRADALKRALAKRARLAQVVVVAPPPDAAARQAAAAKREADQQAQVGREIAKALKTYQHMRMKRARAALEATLARIERRGGRGVTREQLGQIHVLLAAAAQAEGASKSLRAHARQVVLHAPDLTPDPALVSPPLRKALARARKRRAYASLIVRSTPAGATLYVDGVARGETPVNLSKVQVGTHYIALAHPLYENEARRITLDKRGGTVDARLRPATAAQIARAVHANPALAGAGARLLGVDAIVWMTEGEDKAVALGVYGQRGREALAVKADGSAADVDAAAATVAKHAKAGGGAAGGGGGSGGGGSGVAGGGGSAGGGGGDQRDGGVAAHFKRYWWVYAIGAAALGLGVGLTVGLTQGGSDGRDIVMPLPRP